MNMKPRILILMHYMELGGAESALIGLLQNIDTSRVDVDLFVYDRRGEFFPLIPTDNVNLLTQIEAYSLLERPLSEVIKRGYYRLALMRLIGKLDAKLTGGSELVAQQKWTSKVLPEIINENVNENENDNENRHPDNSLTSNLSPLTSRQKSLNANLLTLTYDLAISFLTPHYIVLDHVKAKKKVGWIHTDYTKIQVDAKREVKMWERLDKIVSISPDVTKTFLQVFPSLKDKIVVIENILSPEFVRIRAEESINENDNDNENCHSDSFESSKRSPLNTNHKPLTLLSVGRICEAKNYDNIPYIAKYMKELLAFNGEHLAENDDGLNENVKKTLTTNHAPLTSFHWYIIGPGEHSDIDKIIEETGTGDVITFLGPRSNPYPYIKSCDVYVQPSRYEGRPVTVREAQVLCKPVVVTDFATAPSVIEDGVNGVIVPMDNEGCAKGIVEFLVDEEKQKCIIEHLKVHDYGNVSEVEKVYELLEG